jgi:hypothetical protein
MPLNEHQDAEYREREVRKRRAARDATATENKIRKEYARLGREPVYAGHGILLSPGLVALVERQRPKSNPEKR